MERFEPAIGMLMHNRDLGVAVIWSDFRIEGDKLYAKPSVNETRFPHLTQEIEDGFYKAASCGHIVAIEISEDPVLKLSGQTGPTVIKWFPREISIVDIPGNYNALAKLYDESNSLICDLSVSDYTESTNNEKIKKEMGKIELTDEHIQLLDLKDVTPASLSISLKDLKAKADRVDKAEQDLQALKDLTSEKEVEAIIEKGKLDKKLTNEVANLLAVQYKGNPSVLKTLVAAMPTQNLVTTTEDIPEKYKGKTFSQLYTSGELAELKANYPDFYKNLKEGGI